MYQISRRSIASVRGAFPIIILQKDLSRLIFSLHLMKGNAFICHWQLTGGLNTFYMLILMDLKPIRSTRKNQWNQLNTKPSILSQKKSAY